MDTYTRNKNTGKLGNKGHFDALEQSEQPDLVSLVRAAGSLRNKAERVLQLSSAALAASEIKEAFPDAVYFEPKVEDYGEGPFIDGTVLYRDDETVLAILTDSSADEDYAGDDQKRKAIESIIDLSVSMGSDRDNSYWATTFGNGDSFSSLVSVSKAASWIPSDDDLLTGN
jgi:hypothetical protein